MAESIDVSVAYAAAPGREAVISLKVAPEATLGQVIRSSGMLEAHPEIDIEHCKLGVWGKQKKEGSTVAQNDRIEIYRGLLTEPNATRLARAGKKKRRV